MMTKNRVIIDVIIDVVPDLRINAVTRPIVRYERAWDDVSRQVILHACLSSSKKSGHYF